MHLLLSIHHFFSQRSAFVLFLITSVMLAVLGYIEYHAGHHVSLAVFYFVPVYLGTWYGGRRLGMLNSIVAATVWMVADLQSGLEFPSAWIAAWDFIDRFGIFAIVSLLFGTLHNRLRNEARQANVDALTGLMNRRAFYGRVDEESDRLKRYLRPFTLVYMDLDNFKEINDARGHAEGDELLRAFGDHVSRSTRRTDAIARLGGDEFAALLPETDSTQAKATLHKLMNSLADLMRDHDWPVTVSAGAVTFHKPMNSTEAMVQAVDALMYEVKHSTKAGFRHEVWPNVNMPSPSPDA